MLIGLAVVYWRAGRKYPPATSREAYIIMDALHTACNTKNSGSLDKIEAYIAREKAEGKLGAAEEDAFARIIATARAGRWSEADREAFRFSQDQVGRGQLFDEPHGRGDVACRPIVKEKRMGFKPRKFSFFLTRAVFYGHSCGWQAT